MYAGFLRFGNTVVIDNHMTLAWADSVGLPWLQGCVKCAGLEPRNREYVTPLKDSVKPPWWRAGSRDSLSFFGMYGLEIAGADNSTRSVDTIEGIADGGYTGGRRYNMRTLTVKAIAVAETDTAIGFGLEWLHSLDTGPLCDEFSIGLYESCPCVCGPGCDDPTCQQSCVMGYQREFRRARILSGPTVLQRRTMPSHGAMALVEFQIIAQDPHPYRPVTPFVFDTGMAAPLRDARVSPTPPVDPFDVTPISEVSPWMDAFVPPPPRSDWLRAEHDAPLPAGITEPLVAPEIVVSAPLAQAEDVRVGLWVGQAELAEFTIPFIPRSASVRVDFGSRRVFTEYMGTERANLGFIVGPGGGPMVWPTGLPAADYRLTVDRAPESPAVTVSVAMTGMGYP